eukprot:237391_1
MNIFILLLFVNIYVQNGSCQWLPYPFNETFDGTGTFSDRLYHIAYWDEFLISDPNYEYPVIYALHGALSNSTSIILQSTLHIDASPRGYLTIYPEGYLNNNNGRSRSWNAGFCCSQAYQQGSNDTGFLWSILHDLELQNIPINRNKIFITGHSNGGRMAYRMACEYNQQITAIAPNAGTPSHVDFDVCGDKCSDNCDSYTAGWLKPRCWCENFEDGKCDIDTWYAQNGLTEMYSCEMKERVVPIISFDGYLDPQKIWNGGGVFTSGTIVPPNYYIARWYANIAGCNDYNSDILNIFNYGLNDAASSDLISYYNISTENSNDKSTCITFKDNCTANVTFCTSWIGGHTWNGGYYGAYYCDQDNGAYNEQDCNDWKNKAGNISQTLNNNYLMLELFDQLELNPSDNDDTTRIPDCVCIEQHDPYCCHNETYSNTCYASCDGFSVINDCDKGECVNESGSIYNCALNGLVWVVLVESIIQIGQ